MKNDTVMAVDVAKAVLEVAVSVRPGYVCRRERLERSRFPTFLRGLFREMGIFIPMGAKQVVPAVWAQIEDADSQLPAALRPLLAEGCREIGEIEGRIKMVEAQLDALAEQTPAVAWLLTIPGVGLLTATAIVGTVGDIRRFPSGRHRGFRHGPEPLGAPSQEAGDTSAVRPIELTAPRHLQERRGTITATAL